MTEQEFARALATRALESTDSAPYSVLEFALRVARDALLPPLGPDPAIVEYLCTVLGQHVGRIPAIKVVRGLTGLNLREAKDLVDAAWGRLGWTL